MSASTEPMAPAAALDPVISTKGLTKRFGRVIALNDVSFSLPHNMICALLGRNGAGKTTLLQILTGQGLGSSGQVQVFGGNPFENESVLARVSFAKESQKYPEHFRVKHALRAGRIAYAGWDEAFAQSLLADFRLPPDRRVKKLSRGMFSALGIVIGLASRAPLTLFDEAHIGLDAAARQTFYDRLLDDYSTHPRSIVLSTHLIDEVRDIVEHVLVLDQGRLVVNDSADNLRGLAVTVSGPADAVATIVDGHRRLHTERLAGRSRITILGPLSAEEERRAEAAAVEVTAVSLQQLVIRLTGETAHSSAAHNSATDKTPTDSTSEVTR
jgi:ABC-2 type transport system ATP-binding protein